MSESHLAIYQELFELYSKRHAVIDVELTALDHNIMIYHNDYATQIIGYSTNKQRTASASCLRFTLF